MADTAVRQSSRPTPLRTSVPDPVDSPTGELRAALRRLLVVTLDRSFGIALDQVESFAHTLDGMAARGGVQVGALIGAGRAVVGGKNPLWGAVKGAFAALSVGARAAVVLVLVLAVLLLPVTVLLVLLLLIVVAIIAAVRSGSSR
jgi:hypothetical protein